MVVLSELPEESSSSLSTHGHIYDVFLSFRGPDTRSSFTAYLYKALLDANITTFLDDEDIEIGEDLKPELESAIKASRSSIIVLSKNYATSTWCLDELVLILKQRMTSNHIVFPIFYHVEPTHVRKQQSSFGDAMAKHRHKMEEEINASKRSKWAQKMDQWDTALTKVANLKGKDVNGRKEEGVIEEIVKDIYRRLRISSRSPLPQLIGMDYSIQFVTSWLKDASSHKANVLSILGMGGIGKTSLAKYVYGLHSHEFDRCCFIQDVSQRCEKFNGLLDLQKQLYDDISKPRPTQFYDASIYTSMIENALACRKVFLVLDGIDSLDQLDALLGNKGFHPRSKIIITTNDKWLTESCELFKTKLKPVHTKHELQCLSETESKELLCFHAFKCNDPKADYEEVSKKLVKYCQGHPMDLKYLGRSLHNRDVTYWEGYINRLKKENESPINNVLRMTFDSLPSKNDKDLFKHIACIFVGMDKDVTGIILEACDKETKTGFTNLIDKFLLSIGLNNELMMHQLVQDMGRFLVCEESLYKPWERSHIWGYASFNVLKQEKGTENVLGLTLDMRKLEKEMLHASLELKTDALSKMDNLMLLQLNYAQITGSYKKFPKELRWLCMHGFPLKSIPLDLMMENLVALDMSHSNIESFGVFYSYPQRLHKRLKQLIGSCSKDKKLLGSLKILNLSSCKQLRSLDGFDHLPTHERLILRGCISLLEVSQSIERCAKLILVDLSYCNKLENLPMILGMLNKVKTLFLDGFNLSESRIDVGVIKTNPLSVAPKNISSHSKFLVVSLPRSLITLSLTNTNLSTESFPMDFSCLSVLKELCLGENPIVSMPICVRSLPRLETLLMVKCNMLTSIEHLPHTLKCLSLYFEYDKPLLRKVVFDPQMSPIDFFINWKNFAPSSFEIEGIVKIQPMASVEEKVLRCLGWTELDFLNERCMGTSSAQRGYEEFETQMYYEFGIFSTIYEGEEMPNWIMDRYTGPSVSLTIPSSLNNLRGLNLCYVQMSLDVEFRYLPLFIVSNITKNRTWIYQHYIERVNVNGKHLTLLSHWMFSKNEMEGGDQVTITMRENGFHVGHQVTKECGVSFVYDDGDTNEEEDALSYYKSWNHIIGGDLSKYQLTTGEYILSMNRFMGVYDTAFEWYHLVGDNARFKEKYTRLNFGAFSQRKSRLLEDNP